jgi:glycosyltransferase involved in cell wall biosynthesis
MKLSIIIPIYNVEKYVEKCIRSLVCNNLKSSEYEIIIVDDGSQDTSILIVNELAKQISNIKIFSQKNKGLGGARNTGINNSIGEYLLFLDSDDWYLPNTLKYLITLSENNNLEILEFAAQGVTPNNKVIFHIHNSTCQKVLSGIEYYNSTRYLNSACNKLYKRSFLVFNSLFFLEKIYIEDFEFNTRVFLKAKKVMATDYLAVQFLQSENSITRNKDHSKKEKVIIDFIKIIQITNDLYINEKELKDESVKLFFEERLSFLVTTLFFQLMKYNLSFSKIKKIKTELVSRGLFYIEFPIHDKKKDFFRKIISKNFVLIKFLKPFIIFFNK